MQDKTNGTYPCRAIGCTVPIHFPFLMCDRHWKMVPKDQQRALYDAKKALRLETPDCYTLYREAILKAVDTVEQREQELAAREATV